MGSYTGTLNSGGGQISFCNASAKTPQSLGITLPAGDYPNGTITFNNIKSGGSKWINTAYSKRADTKLYLCDSAGNNCVQIFDLKLNPQSSGYGYILYDNSTSVSNATGLAGKALYICAGDFSTGQYLALDGSTTVTVTTSTNSYTLTTAVSPSGYGTVTAGGSMAQRSTKSLTATPSTGRKFSSWSATSGSLSSTTTNPTTFTMGGSNATVTANFGTNSYTLTTAVSPSGYGTVTAGGSLAYGGTKSLTATPGTGRYFSSWSKTAGTLSSTSTNPTTFTMGAGNATVTANFGTNNYTLTVSKGTGISSVTGGGSKAYGSSNAITATASTGYTFKNWTSNNGGSFANANSSSTNFTMPAGNVTVTANATINSYTLTVAKGTGISAVTGGGTKNYASSNAITATVATGYTFKNWTSNNGGTFANANSASTNFTMPAGNVTVTANATINSYTLTTAVSPSGGGTVTAGGSMNYGATKSLTATASTGYSFSSWSKTAGTLSSTTSNPTTFTMGTSAATVTANFTHISYTLSSAVSPSGGGTVTLGASSGYYNDQINITASASTGYAFSGWTTTGGTIASASSVSTKITMPAANTTVTASFTHVSYSVSSVVSPSGGGTVTLGASSAYYNDSVSITATPETGYQFSGWTTTGGTIASASSASTTLTMPNANVTVTATFTKIDYAITTSVDPAGAGTISTSPSSTAQIGDTVVISQSPSVGFAFDGYTTSPTLVIENDQFTMPASAVSITANYHVTASSCSLDKYAYVGGDTAVLSINLASDTFTHKYKLSFGDEMETEWVTLSAGVDSANIYVPVEWCLHMNSGTASGTLVLETYDNNTLLGDYTISGLTYSALGDTIPSLSVRRCDINGNMKIDGEYVQYAYVKPSSINIVNIQYGSQSVSVSTSPDYVFPNNKQIFAIGSNHTIILSLTYGSETFSIFSDIPKVIIVRKHIV